MGSEMCIRDSYIDNCYSFSVKKLVYLFILGVSVCLTRNNGIHLILPSLLLLFFLLVKGARRYALILAVCVLGCYLGVEKGAAPALGVAPGSRSEMLSVPFQQTARYLREYPDDVTAGEKKAINRILKYDVLAEKYDPEISDPVKITFKFRDNDEDPRLNGYMKDYFKAWFSMFCRHPAVYIQATLNNIYSYNDPFHIGKAQQGVYRFYIDKSYQKKSGIDVSYVFPEKLHYIFRMYDELWMRAPGLGLVLSAGTYTWLTLLLIGYLLLKKQWKKILIFAIPVLNILVCLVSPVNGMIRYMWPVMTIMPMLLLWILRPEEKTAAD